MTVSSPADECPQHNKKWRRRAMLAAAVALAAGTLLAETVFSADPPAARGPGYSYEAPPPASASTRLGDYIQKSSRRTPTTAPKAAGRSLTDRKPAGAAAEPSKTAPRFDAPVVSRRDRAAGGDSSPKSWAADNGPAEVGQPGVTVAGFNEPAAWPVARSQRAAKDPPNPSVDAEPESGPPPAELGEHALPQAMPEVEQQSAADTAANKPATSDGILADADAAAAELGAPQLEPDAAIAAAEPESSEESSADRDAAPPWNSADGSDASEAAPAGQRVGNPSRRVLEVIGLHERPIPAEAPTAQPAEEPCAADVSAQSLDLTPVESSSAAPELPANELVAADAEKSPPAVERPVSTIDRPRAASIVAPRAKPQANASNASDRAVQAVERAEVPHPVDPSDSRGSARKKSVRLADHKAVPGPVTRREVVPAAATAAQDKPAESAAETPADESPFEIVEETGELKVTLRRSKLLILKKDVSRIAIVDPAITDVIQFSPKEASIVGKQVGATHVTFWFDDADRRPMTYLVTVEPDFRVRKQMEEDFRKLEGMIGEMFPDSYIRLTPMADKLIVRGQAKDAEEAAQILSLLRAQAGGGGGGGWGGGGGFNMGLNSGMASDLYNDQETGNAARPRIQIINMLRVPGIHQVALRVKIAELNRSAAREFGLGVAGKVNFTSNPQGSQLFIQSMLGLASGGTAGAAAAPTFLAQFDGDDIRVGIRYMQKAGVLRLLSEPTLVTLSGQPATFVAGGEFAVPTLVGSVGLNAVTTDFRSYGAIIFFVPTVVDKDRIRLQVSPEFSQINSGLTNSQTGTPGLNVRAVTTTVEMREGQTFAIAGLLEDTMKSAAASDIPFLYKLFGTREVNRTETELIILVTPELVHPMDPEEVPPLPGFDVTEPSNYQFFIRGDLEGTPTRDWRSTTWPRLKQRYNAGGSAMISGPFGHGQ